MMTGPLVPGPEYGSTGAGVPVEVHTSQAVSGGASAFGRRYPMFVEFHPGRICPLYPAAVNRFVLPPGRYVARFYTIYVVFRVGKAELTFDTSSGEPVAMSYAAPYTLYSKGAAGFAPRQRPGRGVLIGMYAGVPAVVLAFFLLVLVRHLLSG